MAKTPEGMKILQAEVTSAKGPCSAGHQVGDKFTLSCWDTGGVCGYFYHDIFPSLSVLQFGGKYPWSGADEITVECPDRDVALTMLIRQG